MFLILVQIKDFQRKKSVSINFPADLADNADLLRVDFELIPFIL